MENFVYILVICEATSVRSSVGFKLDDVSINNEYEYENDFKPYSYSKSFSQLSMLAMTPSSSLKKIKLWDST